MAQEEITLLSQRVADLFVERLGIKGPSLNEQIRKAGRLLPKPIRRDAQALDTAATLLGHPKRAHTIDHAKAMAAGERVLAHLEGIDRQGLRNTKILVTLAKISAVLILGFIAFVWYGVKQGWF